MQLITSEVTSTIGQLLDDPQQQSLAIVYLDNLATKRLNDVLPYENKLIDVMSTDRTAGVSSQAAGLLVKLAANDKTQVYTFKQQASEKL